MSINYSTSVSVSKTNLSAIVCAHFRNKQPWFEEKNQTLCDALPRFAIHSSTKPRGAKDEWRVSSWLTISTHVKKCIVFSRVLLQYLQALYVYFLKDHHFWNSPLQLKCLQKWKESQTVVRIKTHLTKFVKWVTSRSQNKCWFKMKISCEPAHGIKERREIDGLEELKFIGWD